MGTNIVERPVSLASNKKDTAAFSVLFVAARSCQRFLNGTAPFGEKFPETVLFSRQDLLKDSVKLLRAFRRVTTITKICSRHVTAG